MLTKGTFGGTTAAVNLDAILRERDDPRDTKRVGVAITDFLAHLRHAKKIADKRFRHTVLLLLHKESIKRVRDASLPRDIETHLRSHLTALYRKSLQEKRGESD